MKFDGKNAILDEEGINDALLDEHILQDEESIEEHLLQEH